MNSLRKPRSLYQQWVLVNHIGSWLRILENSNKYSSEEIIEFENIDTEALAVEKECMEEFRVRIPEVKKEVDIFIQEIEELYGKDKVKAKKLFFLENKVNQLDKILQSILEDYNTSFRRGIPFWFRDVIMEMKNYQKLRRIRNKTQIEIYLLKYSKEIKGYLTPQEIAQASSFPFDQIIQFNRAGFALCPQHEEKKASLHLIKESNRVYCFGCNYTADPIQYVMDVHHLNFPEAVKSLLKL